MTFGEKLKATRLSKNLSQAELARLSGVTERSLYTYEQLGTLPRERTLRKIADALDVSVEALLADDKYVEGVPADELEFLASAKGLYGYRGEKEAKAVLKRTRALLAGGDLDENAKDVFFRALMEVYLESKAEAHDKFTPKKYKDKGTEN